MSITTDPNSRLVDALVTSIRRRQIVGSLNAAIATATLIKNIVRHVKYSTVEELINIIKGIGRRLMDANPRELATGNIIRRIVKVIREENRIAGSRQPSAPTSAPETPYFGPTTPGLNAPSSHYLSYDFSSMTMSPPPAVSRQASLSNFVAMRHSRVQLERQGSVADASLSAATNSLFAAAVDRKGSSESLTLTPPVMTPRDEIDEATRSKNLRPFISQVVDEVLGELETTHDDVAKEAKEHIHSSEVILTMGHSKTVEVFLKQAHKDRKFTVIVAESAPSFLGHSLAANLTSAGITTILIPDSSIHAVMSRCTKVIIGAHSVLANGGVYSLCGALVAALAARAYAKPVVVLSGQFKFAPAWNSYHEFSAVDYQGPQNVLGSHGGSGGGNGNGSVEVVDPYYDYIRPDLVNLFVTNEGDHSPSYVYRIIKEAYDDEDLEL